MTRRRLTLTAAIASAAFGAAWWLSVERLTSTEQRLVGTWRLDPDRQAGKW
jgi:hypothetical protein